MEALWAALYARLTPALDLWLGKAPPEYKGSPDGSPYVIGTLSASDTGDGFTRLVTLTLDGYAYGDDTAHAALADVMEDAHEFLITWRVQDSATGASADWQLETSQPVEDDDLSLNRIRAVYTTRYIGVRTVAAYNDATIS